MMRGAAGSLSRDRQYHVVYVTCFCEEDDLLSQWGRYADAGGYAVGFRVSDLTEAEPAEPGSGGGVIDAPLRLLQVHYGDDAKHDAISEVLATIAPHGVGHPGVQGYIREQTILLPSLAGIKHPAFSEEKEWRLVLVSDQHQPSFRPGPLGVTPYVSLRYPPGAVAEVIVGPGPEQGLREQGVKQLFRDDADVEVRSSAAPFRG
jgi:hypothetical protein